jgi:hypothetical protein
VSLPISVNSCTCGIGHLVPEHPSDHAQHPLHGVSAGRVRVVERGPVQQHDTPEQVELVMIGGVRQDAGKDRHVRPSEFGFVQVEHGH